ncbi:uncharacterized protein [Antedon mediterranea]|uniref:uncharacterized protein n=1 Tax=Antedon mediterranea TaxID=105859 RepID=UPI003AF69977
MSEQKAILDKKNLECAICLERFTEPKTLECLHSYCLHCLQSLMKTSAKLKCPKCYKMYDDLNQVDLKDLTTNEMLSYEVEHFKKIESEKPSTCSSCDNPPEYYCSECQMYLCGQCTQDHKKFPVLKDHLLYTLDKNVEDDLANKCKIHEDCMLEFYCRTCSEDGCKKCEHVLCCYQNEHNVIPFKIAVDEVNQDTEEIKNKLKGTRDTITKHISDFESRIQICKTAIGLQEENIIKKIQEKSRALMADLDKIETENKEVVVDVVKQIDLKLSKVNEMFPLMNTRNKQDETHHEANVNAFREEDWKTTLDEIILRINAPSFIPSKNLDRVINLEGIGKIVNAECTYAVAEVDESITVTKEQSFAVRVVSSLAGSETSLLHATIINESGKESATEVKHHGNRVYKITGRCPKEGDWKMKIIARGEKIKGSPVDIKVEALGLVHTIDNIQHLRLHQHNVKDVILDKDGCIIVSSHSKYLLKLNKEYSFIGRIEVPQDVQVDQMHQMDWECHCVFKFNVDNGECIGTIGSEGTKGGQMVKPCSVTLTKEGNPIVADWETHRIQMFDANDKFMRILVCRGHEDGHVLHPDYVAIDSEENILVVTKDKVQLFDQNGAFIRRIDDGCFTSLFGIEIMTNQPRMIVVTTTNNEKDNLKIYNY